jgi:hypothetical protein
MSQIDPWEKAAECQRAAQAAIDPEHQTILTHLRNLWIALGNERDSMSADDLAMEAEAIGRLHAELINSQQRILH